MEKKILLNRGIITGTLTLLIRKMEIIGPILIILLLLMSLDYISGMLAARKEGLEHPDNKKYGWNSKKGILGIYKKIGYVFTVLVAMSVDYIIYRYTQGIGLEYETKTFFGELVSVWFSLNEILSILENVGRMGVTLPDFLMNVLSELKKGINNKK
ncbi:phage holin family protein [Lachnoclostridium sp. An138]|uniref:phage holin family protein n=1 Tax=Lachnoclostridium sp. An138 TaxID=1965560 RepID=UPI000B36A9F6|nr:phage holin family protein [Lachnoclostridium sp. An138]OUQ15266.1 hypothetical protein B5E82_16085 [Lachnoclostridium sp. An138]